MKGRGEEGERQAGNEVGWRRSSEGDVEVLKVMCEGESLESEGGREDDDAVVE